ncbi:MAG: alpha/beta hydrolase [Ruminococcaceae bacterium]|jgi:alpha-beta hydrolase superfamily lysophospholipase|nr:alpha/beta hydrolase [Oscillospiraceae bacterium]
MSVIRKEAYFNSSTGENTIRTLIWQDDEIKPKAVVQISHGMAEHIGRYDDFARFLVLNGFVVCGNDHLGHGLSVNSPYDYGYFSEFDGDKRLVDDMHILTHIMKKRYPDIPYILFGHSMGSLCARVYAMHFGSEIDGVVFCGTLNVPSFSPVLIPLLDKLVDRFGAHADMEKIVSAVQKAQVILTKDERAAVSWLSTNAENWDNYEEDEMCGFPFKLGGYRDLVALACEACESDWAELIPVGLPIMVISGALDPISFNGRTALKASDQLAIAGHEVEPILYPGNKHEILNEKDNDVVYNDILKFFNSIVDNSEVTA